MQNYNKILEAINRGIQFALDDFEPEEALGVKAKDKVIDKEDSLWQNLKIRENFVDLGLPSGTLWCKYNLGVDPNQLTKPKDWYGNYYAWGETEPNKPKYTPNSYKWNNKQITTRYNSTDGLDKLLPEDDAAYQFNKMLRIPTVKECLELINNTNIECVHNYNSINGLNGYLITNRKDKSKYIFIPATGLMSGSKRIQDEDALIITNERLDGIRCKAMTFEESSRYVNAYSKLPMPEEYIKTMKRICGCSIRPVLNL